jgi:hypothetical protein
MNQSNYSHDITNSDSNQDIEGQQKQIDSLVSSLEQIFDFLEYQKQQGSTDVSNLSVAVQESIKYLTVVVNNLDYLKQEIEMKPGTAMLIDALNKNNSLPVQELGNLKVAIESMKKDQLKLKNFLFTIKKTLITQQKFLDNKFDWKSLSTIVLGVALASSIIVSTVTFKLNEASNNATYKIIQDGLNIKNKGASKVK